MMPPQYSETRRKSASSSCRNQHHLAEPTTEDDHTFSFRVHSRPGSPLRTKSGSPPCARSKRVRGQGPVVRKDVTSLTTARDWSIFFDEKRPRVTASAHDNSNRGTISNGTLEKRFFEHFMRFHSNGFLLRPFRVGDCGLGCLPGRPTLGRNL